MFGLYRHLIFLHRWLLKQVQLYFCVWLYVWSQFLCFCMISSFFSFCIVHNVWHSHAEHVFFLCKEKKPHLLQRAFTDHTIVNLCCNQCSEISIAEVNDLALCSLRWKNLFYIDTASVKFLSVDTHAYFRLIFYSQKRILWFFFVPPYPYACIVTNI